MVYRFKGEEINTLLFEKENTYFIYYINGELLAEFEKDSAKVENN
jgi:hypothetical protein